MFFQTKKQIVNKWPILRIWYFWNHVIFKFRVKNYNRMLLFENGMLFFHLRLSGIANPLLCFHVIAFFFSMLILFWENFLKSKFLIISYKLSHSYYANQNTSHLQKIQVAYITSGACISSESKYIKNNAPQRSNQSLKKVIETSPLGVGACITSKILWLVFWFP